MPVFLFVFLAPVLLTAQFTSPEASAEAIVRQSLERDWMNFDRARDYTFIETTETRRLDGKGRIKKTESESFDVLILGGRPYKKLIEKNGRPLSPQEAVKAEADFEKELRKRRGESEKQRAALAAKQEKERRESRKFLNEIPEAFTFQLAGVEQFDGRPVWVIDAEPRPEFRPKVKRADLLKKFRGRLWIDQQQYQWVRVEMETIETVSFGLFLARLGPGAQLSFEQARVNDEVWLPRRASTRLTARLGLVARLNAETDVEWKQYRKFQTDSRVTDVGELTPLP